MAYVKILTISSSGSHMSAAIAYAAREEKTTRRAPDPDDAERRLEAARTYVFRDEKVSLEQARFATAIGVASVETAAREFMETKRCWGKTDGRLAYQIIQSFAPDEPVSPELAHEIGTQFVRELFPDFEAVVGTHVDRAHVHNHIIINSVRASDGRKAHFKNGYVENVLRKVSDRLCRERGLRVIPPRNRSADRERRREAAGPKERRHFEYGTMREAINRDIRWALSKAKSPADMVVLLEDLGYKADLSGVHPKIRPPEARRFFRLDTFYTLEELRAMCGMPKACRPLGAMRRSRGRSLRERAVPITAPTAAYLRTLHLLGSQERDRKSYVPLSKYRDMRRLEEELAFISRNRIGSPGRRPAQTLEELRAEWKEVNRRRYRLNGRKKKLAPIFEAQIAVSKLEGAEDLSGAERDELDRARAVLSKSGMSAERAREKRALLEEEIYETGRRRARIRDDLKMMERVMESLSGMKEILRAERLERKAVRRPDPGRAEERGPREHPSGRRDNEKRKGGPSLGR